jgi:hypothetical protein
MPSFGSSKHVASQQAARENHQKEDWNHYDHETDEKKHYSNGDGDAIGNSFPYVPAKS